MPRRSTEREESLSTLKGERGRRPVEAVRIFLDVFFSPEWKTWIFEAWIGCHREMRLLHGLTELTRVWFNVPAPKTIVASSDMSSLDAEPVACAMSWLPCEPVNKAITGLSFQVTWDVLANQSFMFSMRLNRNILIDISWYFAVLAVDSAGGAAVLPVASAVMAVMSCMEGSTTGWESSELEDSNYLPLHPGRWTAGTYKSPI